MTAIANACDLTPPRGLLFRPCGVGRSGACDAAAHVGGLLDRHGMVEVVSGDGKRRPNRCFGLRWGVYVPASSDAELICRCFKE